LPTVLIKVESDSSSLTKVQIVVLKTKQIFSIIKIFLI